jgi:hypothetical protein
MLLVETTADLLRRIAVVAAPFTLQSDLSAQLVRAFRLRGFAVGRIDDRRIADPVLGIVDVAAELVLVVVNLLQALSRITLVRVLVHVPFPRRTIAPLPSTSLGPLLEMSARALSALVPVVLARLATLR